MNQLKLDVFDELQLCVPEKITKLSKYLPSFKLDLRTVAGLEIRVLLCGSCCTYSTIVKTDWNKVFCFKHVVLLKMSF